MRWIKGEQQRERERESKIQGVEEALAGMAFVVFLSSDRVTEESLSGRSDLGQSELRQTGQFDSLNRPDTHKSSPAGPNGQ